jgi:hypothetical protein
MITADDPRGVMGDGVEIVDLGVLKAIPSDQLTLGLRVWPWALVTVNRGLPRIR